jgi:hypothetical protein
MLTGDIILVKKVDLQNGQNAKHQTGSMIPLIDPYNDDSIYWAKQDEFEKLLHSGWVYADIYYRKNVAKWEEKLRSLNQERIKKHIGV